MAGTGSDQITLDVSCKLLKLTLIFLVINIINAMVDLLQITDGPSSVSVSGTKTGQQGSVNTCPHPLK